MSSVYYKILTAVVFVLTLVYFISIEKVQFLNVNSKIKKNLERTNESNKCEPINKKYKQNFIKLEGHIYPKYLSLDTNKSINYECLNRAADLKVILLWNTFWHWDDFGYGLGSEDLFRKRNCPVTKCEITKDKSLINISHLVVTHMINKIDDPPKYRPPGQRWMFFLYESPYLTLNDYSQFNNVYNLTATYRDDSDILTPYEASAAMSWQTNEYFNIESDFHQNKTEFAAALISNCGKNSRRLEYINQLQKYIHVDVYGRCGDKKCPEKSDCREFISMKYKYFLAFENSICKNYITEKFFSTLRFNIIPVVLGGGNYQDYVSVVLTFLIFFFLINIYSKFK